MENELIIKRCNHCGAIVKVLKACNCEGCGISCCNEAMQELVPNSVDAAVEKHVPTYEIMNDEILVRVNHVMEKEHYIEWISLVTNDNEETFYLKPGDDAKVTFTEKTKGTLYAYCNKHGLWKKEIE